MVLSFQDGNYRFVQGVFPYSAAVSADSGFEIERVRFMRPVALAEGFKAIEAHLSAIGRPLTALCACELRSPAPFTEEGFRAFNGEYVGVLRKWGIFRDDINPVARSNVCPEIDPPATPSFHAFAYTVPARTSARTSFIVAGAAEAPEGKPNYRDFIIRRGDVSPAALLEKAQWVLGEMERRAGALGVGWNEVTATQLYTIHDVHPFLASELVKRGATSGGLTWHYTRPPVVDLDYEMDCRGVARELVI